MNICCYHDKYTLTDLVVPDAIKASGTWTHVGFTMDPTSGQVKAFIDGEFVKSCASCVETTSAISGTTVMLGSG